MTSVIEEIGRITHAVEHESDRGCVLVISAWMEQFLERLLKAHFKRKSGIGREKLEAMFSFRSEGVLASASARVRVCESLGLIEGTVGKALLALFNYRNACAHWRAGMSLKLPQDLDSQKQLKILAENAMPDNPVTSEDYPDFPKERLLFMNACMKLVICLAKAEARETNQMARPNSA